MRIALLVAVLSVAGMLLSRRLRTTTRRRHAGIFQRLEQFHRVGCPSPAGEDLRALPDPVRRYLQRTTGGATRPVCATRLHQRGELRADTQDSRWMPFEADQVINPGMPGFQWLARVRLAAGITLGVCDRFIDGEASSELHLFRAFRIAGDRAHRQINEAGLQRYLAEAVWSPTALLPAAGVVWQPIDDSSALAILDCAGYRVTLEYRFNDEDEVVSVHTPGRWMREGGRYRKVAWEGHFSDYANRNGMLVPLAGEVGWYTNGSLQIVWRGRIERIENLPARAILADLETLPPP